MTAIWKRLSVPVALALLAGCDLPLGSDEPNVVVRADGGELVIRNTGSTPLYHFAFAYTGGFVDWGPCTHPDHCDGIPPGLEHRVPVTQLSFYERRTADSAAVHTWRLRRVPGGEYVVADPNGFRVGF